MTGALVVFAFFALFVGAAWVFLALVETTVELYEYWRDGR